MILMIPKTQPDRFRSMEKIFMRFVLALTLLSALLLVFATIAVNQVIVVPAAITAATGMLIYVHGGNFLFGFLRIVKFLIVIRPLRQRVSVGRSFLAMVLSPIAGYMVYIAFFFMALTGCAA
ncbi:MAG: hypothetical protein MZW92_12730 [Comamonadaceae bacterium]|nr:hypothetical protein [Comamonadaceae bacterium]